MSAKQLETVVTHALNDSAFRDLLASDPRKALHSVGIEAPSQEVIDSISALDFGALQRMARAFGDSGSSAN